MNTDEKAFSFDIEIRGEKARVEGTFMGNGPEDPCEFDIDAVWIGWSEANRGMPEHAGGPNPLDLSTLTEDEEQAIDDAAWSAVAALFPEPCKNPECEDGKVPDPDACWKPCPDCSPAATNHQESGK